MDEDARQVIAEVQCYSVDSRGYYSDLHEFNFLATLDLNAPLEKSLAESADPGLEFGDPAFEFKCYTGNFLGEHIDLQQKPWQLEYIAQSLKEKKNATFYLCKEDLFCTKPITVTRKRSVVLSRRPSGLAQDFLKKACGSVSGYESGYISDTHGVGGTASSTPDITEEKDSIFFDSPPHTRYRTRPPRQMTIHPSPSVPSRYQKERTIHTAVGKTASVEEETPNGAAVLSHAHSLPSLFHHDVSHQTGTKSPAMQSPEKTKIKSMTLNYHSNHPGQLDQQKRRSHTSSDISFSQCNVAEPIISSPVHTSPEPSPSPEYRLRRANALKRRSMFDLGVIHSTFDISFSPTIVRCHLKDLNVQGNKVSGLSADGILTLQITISNYMTVQELKETICSEIRCQTNVKDLLSSSLVVYYSDNGEQYELLLEQHFMFNTYFHRLSESATPPESGPTLQVRLASLLPAKELRVLYRISQLTGVLLEKDVHTQGVDTSHLTVLPTCDQTELQNARRSLHSYMQKVVRERDEQGYCSCRDIASREASVQLSLMTPADNTVPIIFHYMTEFSLTRHLSIHSFADNALRDVFPALVVCGLVRDKLEDYTLQVTGEESFIYGEIELIAFRHIRKCIVKSEPIHLSVTEKPPVEVERPHQFSWLSVDPYSTTAMNHSELSSCAPICQKDVCSAWEINQKLRLSKIHIEGIPQLPSKGALVHLELQLLHGSSQLCSCIVSSNKMASYYLTWTENMEFDIEIRNTPKAARIMVMVVSGDKSQLLFWGMISVFDPSGRLRTGDSELRLWKGEQVKGTPDCAIPPNYSTHPANNSYHNAVRLNVTFEKIKNEPILYPSTKKASRKVFTKQHPAISYPVRKQFRRMLDMIKKNKLYKSLPHYIKTSHWNELGGMLELFHALDALHEGIEDVPDYVALNLLDSDFPDEHVRSFAVKVLEHLPDEQLEDYLLQLVQALKFEADHDSKLARFLLKKALTSRTIGHFFFWYLKSEMHNRLHMARFAVILEAYLKGCGEAMLTKFTDQVDIQNSLCDMAVKLRRECDNGRDLEKMQSLLPLYLQQLESPRFFFIPVHNPRNILGKLKPQRCKVMSSAKRPMWLEMYNIHPSALRQTPIRLILKLGDDLRQDMITLRMFSLFEKLWQEQGLDLELIPYGCMATSPYTGFIEVVKNARTIKEVSSVTNSTKLFEWIKSHQKNEFGETDQEMLDAAIKRFTRSCAGYSVATYVLGIGDRHNDNIMVTTSGNLFHIDFGHFLGHIKYFMGFKREWSPFVLTPDFVYVMGGENSEMFETYKNLCCRAFLTLRRNADLIISLFSLMRSTGIPELTCVEDTDYIRNVLEMELTSEHVAEMRFRKVIQKCLNLKWTVQIMWWLHIAKHGSE